MTGPDLYMVFDVESAGLHGEGFAVGWVVVSRWNREPLTEGIAVSRTHDQLTPWVVENVLPALPPATHDTEAEIRSAFWAAWTRWQAQGAWLAGDVVWPVEAGFLAACIADDQRRAEAGPYPLIDIASYRLARGFDPLAEEVRLPGELPSHNPLCDGSSPGYCWRCWGHEAGDSRFDLPGR